MIEYGTRNEKFAPVHPGEILLEDFLKPMGISQYRLAHDIGVHPRRINEIVHGRRSITAAAYFPDRPPGCPWPLPLPEPAWSGRPFPCD